MTDIISAVIALVLIIRAVTEDVKGFRIPNYLIVTGMITGVIMLCIRCVTRQHIEDYLLGTLAGLSGMLILYAVREYPKVIPVLFVTIGFGLVGFLDDYLKVVLHRSDGLMPMQKMALQIVITAIFAFYIVKVAKIPLTMLIPFSILARCRH